MSNLPIVTLFTDGSYKGSISKGGYAGVMLCNGDYIATFGNSDDTTNNRMEIMGVLASVRKLTCSCHVHVISDSKYVVNSINGWIVNWAANGWYNASGEAIANVDLWQELFELMQVHQITAEWVKGHRGHAENELCDKLASQAARRPV